MGFISYTASNETPNSQEVFTEKSSSNIIGKTDIAWGHCKIVKEGNNKTAMMCIHCDKIVRGGGINRIKGHLAGEKGMQSSLGRD